MKKLLLAILTCITAGFFTFAGAQDVSTDSESTGFNYPTFQLLIAGGLGYAHNPDMDNFTESEGSLLANDYNTVTSTNDFSAENSTGCFTMAFDAELRYFFNNIGLSVASGYQFSRSKSEVTGSGWIDKGTFTMTLAVIPVIATVYYRGDISTNSFFLLGCGGGYYSGTIEGEYVDDDTLAPDNSYDVKSDTSSTFGFHLKAEYDLVFGNWFLSAGILARYVQFDKFEENGNALKYDGKTIEAGLTGATFYIAGGLSI